MIKILGFLIAVPPQLEYLKNYWVVFGLNVLAWLAIVVILNFVVMRIFKRITRNLAGDIEDILLGILRRPIILLVLLYGLYSSLLLLPLTGKSISVIEKIAFTILVVVITHVCGRVIMDILVYYGEKWALRTESQVDDVLIPIISLFGPIVLTIVAALIILPKWGINITSVLVGAGVVGLVLGLALQETLSNIFGGLSILIEAPFKRGDLIQLPDDRICEVQRLGLRSTTLLSLDEQATIYMPNKNLASNPIINLTKPTSEQKYCIEVNVGISTNLTCVRDMLDRIANGHPAVLSSDIPHKLQMIREEIRHIRDRAMSINIDEYSRKQLLTEADKNERSLARLEVEGRLNSALDGYKESIRQLIRAIKDREMKGLTDVERDELLKEYINPISAELKAIQDLAMEWAKTPDGWLNHSDFWNLRKVWDERNGLFQMHWQNLVDVIKYPNDRIEMRLDDMSAALITWMEKEYKITPGYWKNPSVVIKEISGNNAVLQLFYYVDNIRLEMDGRPKRVRTELSRIIQESMLQEGIWS